MEYSKLKVPELKEELKRRGLRATGLKREMVSRLKDADRMYKGTSSNQPSFKELINGASSSSLSDGEHPDQIDHHALREQHKRDREERAKITIWRKPLTTLQYFMMESSVMLVGWCHRLWDNRKKVAVLLLLLCSMMTVYHLEGSHQKYITSLRKSVLWCWYWVVLGILSSVGLGTGLHTFLLYLGPHIASVTIAAFECMSVDFPEPPYPDEIVCPEEAGTTMTIWAVISKVRLEAFMWGAGTALGELPPYFMAKAARLSGNEPDNEDYEEFEDMIEHMSDNPNEQDLGTRMRRYVQTLVQRVGFFGILACASIPNPLFDLAGITCGHFLVDFWTFFGATLVGKAIVKMHIQKLFVIGIFSEHHVDMLVDLVGKIPKIGTALQSPFRDYLQKQKEKLHHKPGEQVSQGTNWLSWVFEKVIIVMVIYFIISIVNSMAQRYAKRLQDEARDKRH